MLTNFNQCFSIQTIFEFLKTVSTSPQSPSMDPIKDRLERTRRDLSAGRGRAKVEIDPSMLCVESSSMHGHSKKSNAYSKYLVGTRRIWHIWMSLDGVSGPSIILKFISKSIIRVNAFLQTKLSAAGFFVNIRGQGFHEYAITIGIWKIREKDNFIAAGATNFSAPGEVTRNNDCPRNPPSYLQIPAPDFQVAFNSNFR